MDPDVPTPFWRFSLAVYALPGVAEACLELQEGAGADVNVLLYNLWLGSSGRRLEAADMASVVMAVDGWRREIVAPLRAARRALKTPTAAFDASGAEALRQAVKAVELEAERLQQNALYAWRPLAQIGSEDEPAAAAAANVETYGATLGRRFSPEPVLRLLSAALACAPKRSERT